MNQPAQELHLGGFGGIGHRLGVRWGSRGKDAGSPRMSRYGGDSRTPHRGVQRGPRPSRLFRQTLLGVVPEQVGSSGPPWRLSAVKAAQFKEAPDETSR